MSRRDEGTGEAGIDFAVVEADQMQVRGGAPDPERDAALDHLFRHWRLSPAMRQLRRLLGAYNGSKR